MLRELGSEREREGLGDPCSACIGDSDAPGSASGLIQSFAMTCWIRRFARLQPVLEAPQRWGIEVR